MSLKFSYAEGVEKWDGLELNPSSKSYTTVNVW